MGGALVMDGLAWALGGVSPVDVTPDTPFLRSIVDDAPRVPRADVVLVASRSPARGASARYGCERRRRRTRLAIPYAVVPAFHGGMLDDETTATLVTRMVAGKHVRIDDGWSLAEEVIQAGASSVAGSATHLRDQRFVVARAADA